MTLKLQTYFDTIYLKMFGITFTFITYPLGDN